jgi:hypothetical protein
MGKRQIKTNESLTIEYLEQDFWGDKLDYDSHLVSTIYKLRKKNLDQFTVEDFRIVIGQNRSLPILMPMAIDVLDSNILAEGDLYPGDLLNSVLTVSSHFWIDHPDLKSKLESVFLKNKQQLLQNEDLSDKDKTKFFTLYDNVISGNIDK